MSIQWRGDGFIVFRVLAVRCCGRGEGVGSRSRGRPANLYMEGGQCKRITAHDPGSHESFLPHFSTRDEHSQPPGRASWTAEAHSQYLFDDFRPGAFFAEYIKAFGSLKSFPMVRQAGSSRPRLKMHRIVQLSMRRWLEQKDGLKDRICNEQHDQSGQDAVAPSTGPTRRATSCRCCSCSSGMGGRIGTHGLVGRRRLKPTQRKHPLIESPGI